MFDDIADMDKGPVLGSMCYVKADVNETHYLNNNK